MGLQQFDEFAPFFQRTGFVTADGTALKNITTLQNQRIRVDSIICQNQDTIAHVVSLNFTDGTGNCFLGSVSVPAGQGTAGTPGQDVLAGCLPTNVTGLVLPGQTQLQVSLAVAVAGAVQVTFGVLGGYV